MKYGFLGCGNMGGALAKALNKATKDILITDRSGRVRRLAEELGLRYVSGEEIVSECDRIFLAVKPHMMEELLAPLRPQLRQRRPVLISMAAGLTVAQIEQMAGGNLPVIRIMPNTPVAVGQGMTQYCHNALVTEGDLHSFLEDMRFSGRLDELEERLMDSASALSGCIPRAKALEYAAATMVGAGEMVLTTGLHPGALKDAVCSPGGSTIAGVRALEQHAFRAAAMDCVAAAYEKNQQLGKGN